MTAMPHTIGADIPIKKVGEMMLKYDVRHLPVKKAGKLVGIISDRDVKAARSYRGPGELTAEEVMTPDPYLVAPDAELGPVALEMSEHRYGSVLIQDGAGEVIGIFTDTDALRVLGQMLQGARKLRVA
ncbi:MAG: CBS domain-containing protein [Deltaproteobacteria bacterium]|nr:CBS domain-containing protein [Deltaproteobacteria bacterium]